MVRGLKGLIKVIGLRDKVNLKVCLFLVEKMRLIFKIFEN